MIGKSSRSHVSFFFNTIHDKDIIIAEYVAY